MTMTTNVLVGGKRRDDVLLEARERLARKSEEPEATPPEPGSSPRQPYQLLDWDHDWDHVSPHLVSHSFENSLKGLKGRRYERHPTPAEMFSLLFDGMDGTLPEDYQKVYLSLKNRSPKSLGEFLDCAILLAWPNLTVVTHPPDFRLQDNFPGINERLYSLDYNPQLEGHMFSLEGFSQTKTRYSIAELNACTDFPLNALIQLLWHRPFEQIPEPFRQEGYLELKANWMWYPAIVRQDFSIHAHELYAGSRGVRAKQPSFPITDGAP